MPEISVIIPVYNVENKLRRCLDSLLLQSFCDYELILVNDGSVDLSGDICDEYAAQDKRVKVVHQENSGVSVARNAGMAIATGNYLVFVDSDDYVEREYLHVLYGGMQNNCQLSICGIYFCSEGSDKRFIQKDYKDFRVSFNCNNTKCISDLLMNRRFNYVYGKLYRKDLIEKYNIRFQEQVSLGEDTIFVMDYLKYIDNIQVVGGAYYNYIKYKVGTLTHKFYKDLFERYAVINRKITMLFHEKGMLDEHLIFAIDERILYATMWSIQAIRKEKSIGIHERIKLINRILCAEELVSALQRNIDLENEYPELKVMKKQSSVLLLMYYVRVEVITQKIKIIIVKIIPASWIRRGKKWVSNVRLSFRHIMQKNV